VAFVYNNNADTFAGYMDSQLVKKQKLDKPQNFNKAIDISVATVFLVAFVEPKNRNAQASIAMIQVWDSALDAATIARTFDDPTLSVHPGGKLSTTWGRVKAGF
jgi:hypothetical protein